MAERSSRRFHQETKDVLGGPPVPADLELWPESWLTIEYKTYPRLPKIELPQTAPSADFFDIVKKRSSKRTVSGGSVKLEALSSILRYSCGIVSRKGGMHRAQPSAGTRFPLEVYPLVLHGSDALPAGLYHYGVKEHVLDVLWQKSLEEEVKGMFTYEWSRSVALILLITAVFERTQEKYGERGYRYCLLEAGHVGQGIYLAAGAMDLSCCALAGTHDEVLEKLIDIDGSTESLVYALALG
ncbi:MAG TPA: SagB/ThcOx family dehydrogenase [Candidatus Paceibacterota bacterium]